MNRRLLPIFLLAAALLATGRASATIVVSMDLTQLVAGADAIVYGRVVDVDPVRVDGRFTDSIVTLAPSAYLKGTAAASVSFRVSGGEIGRYRTIVVGSPVFREGDVVVVFLASTAPQLPHLVGFSQGVLRAWRDADASSPMVLVPPAAESATPERVVRGAGTRRVMSITDLATEVTAIVEHAAGARHTPAAPRRGPVGVVGKGF